MQMKKILVTVVSDQTIPNVLFIKEKYTDASTFLFITTVEMEQKGKTDATIKACQLNIDKTQRILVNGTKPAEVIKELRNWIDLQHAEQKFLVNLTGGTKMMTLAIHSLFSNFSSDFYYLPIGKNTIVQVLEHFEEKETPISYRLGLYEYLKANNLQYSVKEGMIFTASQCNEIFNAWAKSDFQSRDFPLKLAESFTGFDMQVENAPGEWFEEYVYFMVRGKYTLNQNRISSSVMIFTDDNSPHHDNEFDLMWVHENEIYVAECKVTLGNKPRQKLDTVMYKLGAINKSFGLKTHSLIYTMANLRTPTGNFSANLLRRLRILNINSLADKTTFIKY